MLPSQVRRIILDDHRWLRELLGEVEALARRVEAGERDLAGRLREQAAGLRERFFGHLALEEEQLVPALRDADAWGEARAADLAREHAAQRERFDHLLHSLRQPCGDCDAVARELRGLVADLLADMQHEEAALLSERVLHDDPVVVDAEPD